MIRPDVITELNRLPSFEELHTEECRKYLSDVMSRADTTMLGAPFVLVRRDIAEKTAQLLDLKAQS